MLLLSVSPVHPDRACSISFMEVCSAGYAAAQQCMSQLFLASSTDLQNQWFLNPEPRLLLKGCSAEHSTAQQCIPTLFLASKSIEAALCLGSSCQYFQDWRSSGLPHLLPESPRTIGLVAAPP